MVERLNRAQLLDLMDIVGNAERTDVTGEQITRALLLFCANCPDPAGAMRLVVSDLTPRTNEELVDFALAMPARDVRDSKLLPSHPLRHMRLDD